VNLYEAKTHLSRLLARVAGGETIVIAKGGRPVAILSLIDGRPAKRELGFDAGRFEIPPEFFDPLPEFEEYT
jgi:antitoxin (DNA-binding transcriptional repressor) of toxin-antitoxin stability system